MKYLAPASRCSVSSGFGMAYASLMVLLFSFLKSTQNLIVPSFFLTITTFEEYGLYMFNNEQQPWHQIVRNLEQ